MKRMIQFLKEEQGQGMMEYGLIITLVALAVIIAITLLGSLILGDYTEISNELPL